MKGGSSLLTSKTCLDIVQLHSKFKSQASNCEVEKWSSLREELLFLKSNRNPKIVTKTLSFDVARRERYCNSERFSVGCVRLGASQRTDCEMRRVGSLSGRQPLSVRLVLGFGRRWTGRESVIPRCECSRACIRACPCAVPRCSNHKLRATARSNVSTPLKFTFVPKKTTSKRRAFSRSRAQCLFRTLPFFPRSDLTFFHTLFFILRLLIAEMAHVRFNISIQMRCFVFEELIKLMLHRTSFQFSF